MSDHKNCRFCFFFLELSLSIPTGHLLGVPLSPPLHHSSDFGYALSNAKQSKLLATSKTTISNIIQNHTGLSCSSGWSYNANCILVSEDLGNYVLIDGSSQIRKFISTLILAETNFQWNTNMAGYVQLFFIRSSVVDKYFIR